MAPRTQPRSPQSARLNRVAGQAQARGRSSRSPQTRSARTFGRTPAQTRGRVNVRRRQPQPKGGAGGLLQRLGGALPIGGSSGKRGSSSSSGVGGLLKSLGGNGSSSSKSRGGKPAMLGLLGAGAAGAAMIAKRRKDSSSSDLPAIQDSSENQAPVTYTPPRQEDSKPARQEDSKPGEQSV